MEDDFGSEWTSAADHDADSEASLAAQAARDDEPAPVEGGGLRWRVPDLADVIEANNALPWVTLHLGADKVEIARARAKSMIVMTAPSGAGKTSLALEMSWRHALEVGPVVYLSLELDADEAAGRIVGQRCLCSWEDALRCRVPRHDMDRALALPRMVVLATEDATIARLVTAVELLRAENPGQPVLVVVDYLQLLVVGESSEERIKVSNAVEHLRRLAQRLAVVLLVLSQTSRAVAAQLKDGGLLGAETAATGAETAQIERAGALTIALGGMKVQEDGETAMDLSIGKGRMGQGDRVYQALYDGKTGLTRIMGEPERAEVVRAKRLVETDSAKVARAADAIAGHLAAATGPKSISALRTELGINRSLAFAAASALLAEDRAVRVRGRKVGGAWPLWHPDLAARAGVDVVPEGAE